MQLRKQPWQAPHRLDSHALKKLHKWVNSCIHEAKVSHFPLQVIYTTPTGVFWCVGGEGQEWAGASAAGTCLREAESCLHGLLSPAPETGPQSTPPCSDMPHASCAAQMSCLKSCEQDARTTDCLQREFLLCRIENATQFTSSFPLKWGSAIYSLSTALCSIFKTQSWSQPP